MFDGGNFLITNENFLSESLKVVWRRHMR